MAPLLLRARGSELRLHASFGLLLVILGAAGIARNGSGGAILALGTTILWLASAIHLELFRWLALHRMGIATREVHITPLGGVVWGGRSPDSLRSILAYSFGGLPGPITLALASLGLLRHRAVGIPSPMFLEGRWLGELFWLNLMLIALHAIPLYPLGMGRLLAERRALRRPAIHATSRDATITRIVGLGAAAAGLAWDPRVTVLGVFLYLLATEEERVQAFGTARITGRFGQRY